MIIFTSAPLAPLYILRGLHHGPIVVQVGGLLFLHLLEPLCHHGAKHEGDTLTSKRVIVQVYFLLLPPFFNFITTPRPTETVQIS